jgi:protein PhnA
MLVDSTLAARGINLCELFAASVSLSSYSVFPQTLGDEKNTFKVCGRCLEQLDNKNALDGNHWRCLSSSIWSEVPGVKVVSYRLLHQLRKESWAQDRPIGFNLPR